MSNSSKFCSHCGMSVNEDDAFCNNCGANLDETIEPIVSESFPHQQQPYTQPVYTQPGAVYAPKPKSLDALAYLSMSLGIAAVVFGLISVFVGFLVIAASVTAIILGGISVQKTQKKYVAIAGIVLGGIGIALYILAWFGLTLWYLI